MLPSDTAEICGNKVFKLYITMFMKTKGSCSPKQQKFMKFMELFSH